MEAKNPKKTTEPRTSRPENEPEAPKAGSLEDSRVELRKLDLRALFSDETPQYRYPEDIDPGDEVRFRFRTLRNNACSVYFVGRSIRRKMKRVAPILTVTS